MRKQKIYLDTSVISHLSAEDTPDKMADTLRLWDRLESGIYDVVVSRVVLEELTDCPEPKGSYLLNCISQIPYLLIQDSDDILELAEKFIDFGMLKRKSIDDCIHIATAIVAGCDGIVSWNFKHIVNVKTIKGVKAVTTNEGYKDLWICSPAALLEGGVPNE